MQILIDAIKLQQMRGTKFPCLSDINPLQGTGTLGLQEKDDVKALQNLTNILRCVLAEAIKRDLPISKAFAHSHLCEMNRESPKIASVLQSHRSGEDLYEQSSAFRQHNRGRTILEEIQNEYKKSLDGLRKKS